MLGVSSKSFDTPDETRTPDKTTMEVLRLSVATVARITFQPGWKWSECIEPVAEHRLVSGASRWNIVLAGLRVVHNDGTEGEVTPGDAYVIEPGHDAWVVRR